jgi:hypothetical protein
MTLLTCRDCPGHYLTVCPTCSERIYDPPLRPDCGPPTTLAREAPSSVRSLPKTVQDDITPLPLT